MHQAHHCCSDWSMVVYRNVSISSRADKSLAAALVFLDPFSDFLKTRNYFVPWLSPSRRASSFSVGLTRPRPITSHAWPVQIIPQTSSLEDRHNFPGELGACDVFGETIRGLLRSERCSHYKLSCSHFKVHKWMFCVVFRRKSGGDKGRHEAVHYGPWEGVRGAGHPVQLHQDSHGQE